MVLLRASGQVIRTEPQDDRGTYRDVELGVVPSFKHETSDFIEVVTRFTDRQMGFTVGPVQGDADVSLMPYVYGAGKVRISTSHCRVQIREMWLRPL
jgi:hypothetical protein